MQRKLFTIEGGTGAGKTTLAHILKKYLEIDIVLEPFIEWEHIKRSENLFELSRQDPHRWTYTFQNYAFFTELEALEKTITQQRDNKTIISDRSMYSGLCCYTKMFFDQGILSDLEWNIYQHITSWLLAHFHYVPSGFIYLRIPPEICFERDKSRNRPTSFPYTKEFFHREHDYLDAWLLQKKNCPVFLKNVPVLVVDDFFDFLNNSESRKRIIAQIHNFINK